MSPSCSETRDRLEGYASETLRREERRAVREHLSVCPDCRAEATAADPLFLFAGTAPAVLPQAEAEASRVLEAVRAGIALRQAERKFEPPARRRRWGALASAAAALVLTLSIPGAPERRQAGSVAEAPRGSAGTGLVPAAAPVPPGRAFGHPDAGQKFPADATIYDWNPGAGQPRVVWIVDRSIDI